MDLVQLKKKWMVWKKIGEIAEKMEKLQIATINKIFGIKPVSGKKYIQKNYSPNDESGARGLRHGRSAPGTYPRRRTRPANPWLMGRHPVTFHHFLKLAYRSIFVPERSRFFSHVNIDHKIHVENPGCGGIPDISEETSLGRARSDYSHRI